MTGPSGVDKAHVETIIADLRRTYEQLRDTPQSASKPTTWSMRLTIEEVGALLAIHDEVIELRRQTIGDWEPDFPPVRVETLATGGIVEPGSMPLVGEDRSCVFPTLAEAMNRAEPLLDVSTGTPRCDICEGEIEWLDGAASWRHADPQDFGKNGGHLAIPRTSGVLIRTCPHAGTHHSCPLGGCPTLENREVTIPDLPQCESAQVVFPYRRCILAAGHPGAHQWRESVGREERETPYAVRRCRSRDPHQPHVWRDELTPRSQCPGRFADA